MRTVPFVDLKAQYHSIQGEVDEAIRRVLERGIFILGEEVVSFEQEFAAYCGLAQTVGVNSGTAALQLALLACGIGERDEVITVTFTSVATVAAIELTGARPVLVDIDLPRYGLDPEKIASAITPRTRAVVPVHLYGFPVEMTLLLETARKHHLFVIEDCAQAHGARYRGKRAGGWGDIAAFSFYPTKNLGAYGDGGAVVTDDPELADRVRLIRQYGWKDRQISTVKGLNTRLDDLQAAVLRVKLRHLDDWNARRCALAHRYREQLEGTSLILPCQPAEVSPVYHLYVVRHPRRNELQAYLKERGIQTLVHYPMPVHLQPAYADLGYHTGDFPQSEIAAQQVLSLPLYPEMDLADVDAVCQTIRNYFREHPA